MKTTNTNNSLSLNEAIIDLYLNVKIRKQDEVEKTFILSLNLKIDRKLWKTRRGTGKG